jgi:hypothetical protein
MYPWKEPWKELTLIVLFAIAIGVFLACTRLWHIDVHQFIFPLITPKHINPHLPTNVTLYNVTVTNNQTLPLLSYGIAALSSMVGLVALVMTFMGVFLTLVLVTVGNFRQHFITTLDICNEKRVDMSEVVMMRKWWFRSKPMTLLGLARERTDKIHENSRVLGIIIILATLFSLFTLVTVVYITFFCCSLHIDDLWTSFWEVLLFYVFFLIGILISIFAYVAKIVSYPDLAELHKALAEHIIGKITNDQEKLQEENTDSKSKQETPSENMGDKKES